MSLLEVGARYSTLASRDPDFPDALFVKAQILSDGFEDSAAARQYFTKVMEVVPNEDETLHRWGLAYCDELTRMEKRQ